MCCHCFTRQPADHISVKMGFSSVGEIYEIKINKDEIKTLLTFADLISLYEQILLIKRFGVKLKKMWNFKDEWLNLMSGNINQ